MEADDELKVLILTGAGRAFCSGADLTTVSTEAAAQKSRQLYLNPFDWLGQVFLRFRELSKPTIAATGVTFVYVSPCPAWTMSPAWIPARRPG